MMIMLNFCFYYYLFFCCFFFFFQAEDGIRDIGVTGVQTCALPISRFPTRGIDPAPAKERQRGRVVRQVGRPEGTEAHMSWSGIVGNLGRMSMVALALVAVVCGHRSEERRVGKEGRVRRSRERGEAK